jgi:DNA-binding beta-propeller fold protein YncE
MNKKIAAFTLLLTIVLSINLSAVQYQEKSLPEAGVLPDSHFYFFKTIGEDIKTFFTLNQEKKLERYIFLSEKRLAEAKALAEKNAKPELIEKTLERYQKRLGKTDMYLQKIRRKKPIPELEERLSAKLLNHQEILLRLKNKVPFQGRRAIENAIARGQRGFLEALNSVSEEKKINLKNRFDRIKKCGDGICDEKEQKNPGLCPEDCEPHLKTCSQQKGNICSEDEVCSGSWIEASDTERCCGGECIEEKNQEINLYNLVIGNNFNNIVKISNPVIDEQRGRLYVAGFKTTSVGVVDLNTEKLVEVFDIGVPTGFLIFDRENLYSFDLETKDCYLIDLDRKTAEKVSSCFVPSKKEGNTRTWQKYTFKETGYNRQTHGFPPEWRQDLNAAYGVIEIYDSTNNNKLGEIIHGPDALYFAIDKKRGRLYTTNTGDSSLSIFDLNKLEATDYCKNNACWVKDIKLGISVEEIIADKAGNIYVRNRLGGSVVYKYNQNTKSLSVINNEKNSQMFSSGIDSGKLSMWPTGMALNRDNQKLYVLSHYGALIDVVDTATNKVISKIRFYPDYVDLQPRTDSISSMTFDELNERIYAVWPELGVIGIADARNERVVGTIDLTKYGFDRNAAINAGPGLVKLAVNGNLGKLYVYFSKQKKLIVFNVNTLAEINEIPLSPSISGNFISNAEKGELYLGNLVLDADSLNVKYQTPTEGDIVGFNNKRDAIYVRKTTTVGGGNKRETVYEFVNNAEANRWELGEISSIESVFYFSDDSFYVGYFTLGVVEKYSFTSLSECPLLTPPSPWLKKECEEKGGVMELKEDENGCPVKYECELPSTLLDYEDSPFGFIQGEYGKNKDGTLYIIDLGVHWDKPYLGPKDGPRFELGGKINFEGRGNLVNNLVLEKKLIIPLSIPVFIDGKKLSHEEYREFCEEMIERYDGDGIDDALGSPLIKYWMVGGPEMNRGVPQGVDINKRPWKLNEKETAEYVKIGYDCIKKINPSFNIILGGSGGIETWKKGGRDEYYYNLISELTGNRYCPDMIFDYHQGSNALEYKGQVEAMNVVKETLDKFGYRDNEIWTTDIGGSWDDLGGFTEREHAGDVIRRYAYTLAHGQKKLFWTRILEYDWTPDDSSIFDFIGLVNNPKNNDGKSHKKLAYYTYKLMVEKLEGSDWDNIEKVIESTRTYPNVYVYKFTKKDTGKPVWVAWWDYWEEQGKTSKTITLYLGNSINRVKITEAVPKYESGKDVIDYETAFNTEIKEVKNGKLTLTLKENPVFIEIQSEEYEPILLNLLKVVEIDKPNGYRPEIVATDNRVFVIYAYNPPGNRREFKVKIFNKDMTREIKSKTIISPSREGLTDIRVASDGDYLYVFYEGAGIQSKKAFLYGAKYSLDDSFKRVAYTGVITSGPAYKYQKFGDERTDDPAPVISNDGVYVVTMYKDSFSKEGSTRYHVRRFDKNLNKISEFDLDLSDIADGAAGQPSIIFENGYYYMVMRTTVGNCPLYSIDWQCPADLIMAKLDRNWQPVEHKIVAKDVNEKGEEHIESYVTGIASDENYFYIAYNRKDSSGIASVIKVFDKNWNTLLTKEYKHSSKNEKVRPSIYVGNNLIYAGNNGAEVYVLKKTNLK